MLKNFYIIMIVFIIVGCSTGSNANNNVQYGQLVRVDTLKNTTVEELQSNVQAFVCPGIALDELLLNNNNLINQFKNPNLGKTLCDANYNYIQTTKTIFGNIALDSFVKNNTSQINMINSYQMIYKTPGQGYYYNGNVSTTETVSGLVIMPQTDVANIKGIVLYYHPTVLSKFEVPSNINSQEIFLLGAIYASQGYIVVAPDYVGQGIDSSVMHPYVVYPQNNALSGLYMLNALRTFLASNSASINIPLTTPLNLYISSYSEGGAYALWASRLLQGDSANILSINNLTLKRTIGISGAYDLGNAMIPFAYTQNNNSNNPKLNIYNVSPGMISQDPQYLLSVPPFTGLQQTFANYAMTLSKISLASYAFSAYINYNFTPVAFEIFFPNQNFVNMQACLDIGSYLNPINSKIQAVNCPLKSNLGGLFMNTDPTFTSSAIANTIGASGMIANNYFTNKESVGVVIATLVNGGNSNNSANVFANPVTTDPIIMSTINQANTSSFITNNPLSLIYLNYDSTVTNINSKNACSASGVLGLSKNGAVNCIPVDNTQLFTAQLIEGIPGLPPELLIPMMLDHASAEFILNLVALNQINSPQ